MIRLLYCCAIGGMILYVSWWGFWWGFGKAPRQNGLNLGKRKTPRPIESTCLRVMELIAGFEPATSSLPTRFRLIFRAVSFRLIIPPSHYYQRLSGFSIRLVLSRFIRFLWWGFGGLVGFWWGSYLSPPAAFRASRTT